MNHAFISYSHLDNRPLPTEKEGWVTIFHETLQGVLSNYLGMDAAIWRDKKLADNDVFSDEILEQLARAAVLVSILTPRYVNSQWCNREIDKFCEAAKQGGRLVVGNKSRVFTVVKTPIAKDAPLPSIVRETRGYEFFDLDDRNAPQEFSPAFGEKARHQFLMKVSALAWDIKQLLEQLREGTAPAAEKPAIYLAECARDRRDARDAIEVELKRLGYRVLPDRQLPTDESALVDEVESLLRQCRLSIHLVGNSYGAVPDGPTAKSVTVLQNEIAVRICKAGDALQRVISVPAGTKSEHPRQQEFIEALHDDADAQYGADLITGGLEDLKSTIATVLKKIAEPAVKPGAAGAPLKKLVYVICDAADRMDTVALVRTLKARGLDITLGDAATIGTASEKLLTSADAVILFYGTGDETWKTLRQLEIRNSKARRGGSPLIESTYLASPATRDKEFLVATSEDDVINGMAGFSPEALEPFFRTLGLGTAKP